MASPTSIGPVFEGNTIAVRGLFQQSNVNTDPLTVTCTYTSPAPASVKTTLTYSVDPALSKTATGDYQASINVTTSGIWTGSFRGTWSGGKVTNQPWQLEVDNDPNYP